MFWVKIMKLTLKMLCSIAKIRPSLNRVSIQYIAALLTMGVSNFHGLWITGKLSWAQVNCEGGKCCKENVTCNIIECSKKVVWKIHCHNNVHFIVTVSTTAFSWSRKLFEVTWPCQHRVSTPKSTLNNWWDFVVLSANLSSFNH